MKKILIPLLVLLMPVAASAQLVLSGGKAVKLKDKAGRDHDSATIKFAKELLLTPPLNTLCPTTSSIRLVPSVGPATQISLNCANWAATGSGFKYGDRSGSSGGVTKINYKAGKLAIGLKGSNYAAIGGPLTSFQVTFSVGAVSYCGRFTLLKRNAADLVVFSGPSSECIPEIPTVTPTPTITPTPIPVANCPSGFDCAAFTVQNGPGGLHPTDDGHSSWFKITNLVTFTTVDNGTSGAFASDPLALAKSQTVDGSGISELRLVDPVVLGAPFPAASGLPGWVCFRIEQDPDNAGWIDCDGGSSAIAQLSIDSNGSAAEGAPNLSIGGGADSGAGGGVLRVKLQAATTASNAITCDQADFGSSRVITTGLSTATATAQVLNSLQHATNPTSYPASTISTTLNGVALSCDNWLTGQQASLAAPLFALDSFNSSLHSTFDLAEVLRLDLASSGSNPADPTTTPTPTLSLTPTLSPTPQAVSCPPGTTCAAYNIVPGPGALLPADDGASTWLRLFDFTGLGIFGNAANGQFGPSPIVLAKGANNGSGVAPLSWVGTSYIGANLVDEAQQFGEQGTICLQIQQDPNATGWIDCDGGTNATASLTVDSQLGNPPPPNPAPVLNVPGAADGGAVAGSSVVRVVTRFTKVPVNNANCSAADYSAAPAIATAFTTSTATSLITNDWIDGSGPESHGPNTTTLSGVPFSCAGWGSGSGANASVAAPLFALDFSAPIVAITTDVAQVFRLNLQPGTIPNPNDTPTVPPTATATAAATSTNTETATSTASMSPTLTPTQTATPTVTLTGTPSTTPTRTATPTITLTFTPVPTCTLKPTTTPPPTPSGAILSSISIVDGTSNFGPTGATFVGNCRTQGKTSGAVTTSDGTSFSSRFGSNVADDCETTLADDDVNLASTYHVDFGVTCPAGWNYQLNVSTSLLGNLHIHGDENESCSGAASTGVNSTATVSAVTGSNAAGTLTSGSLGLATAGTLTGNNNHNLVVDSSGSATIIGSSSGATINQSLTFSWTSTCSSKGDAGSQGAECQVALGAATDLSCWNSGYPGTQASEGHVVSVTAQCFFPTPSPVPTCTIPPFTSTPTATPTITLTPTATPTGPTQTPTVTPTITMTPSLTPSRTPTPTPVATALGTLNFFVVTGPGGSDTSPGCPGEPSNGSLLKTDGGPTGGVPGTICNGTKGHFQSFPANTPLQLVGGVPDGSGVASLTIGSAVVFGSDLPTTTPNCGSTCEACWRIEQDATAGFVDCDGGSNADVNVTINSNGSSAPGAGSTGPYLLGSSDSGSGAAVLRAVIKRKRVNGSSTCPSAGDSAWNSPDSTASVLIVTGTAVSRIDSPHVCSGNNFGTACPSKNPFTVTLVGSNLSCGSWTSQTGKKLVTPFQNLEEAIGGSFSNGDIAQVLRLQN